MSTYISRKGYRQVGWRLPRALVAEVQAVCKAEGIRPGQFMERVIRRHFGQDFGQEKIYTAGELETIVRYPPHLRPPKETLESRSKIA